MTERTPGYHATLASPGRRRVLDALAASPEALDATAVATGLGLHVTTARFHLDQLVDAGLARRRAGSEKRRGRPRMLYAPTGVGRGEDAREQLIDVLAAALAGEQDASDEAIRAGRRWAASFDPPEAADPLPGLVDVLARLGFDPEQRHGPEHDEGTIVLRECPFRGAARTHPEVVCGVHRGLVEQLTAHATATARLLPFVEPDRCLVTLERRPA